MERQDELLPVKVLSRKFRGKLLAFIKDKLDPTTRDILYKKEWVVYIWTYPFSFLENFMFKSPAF